MTGDRGAGLMHSPKRWIVFYFIGIAAVATLKLTDAIEGPVAFILLAAATALLLPLARRRANACGSRAMADYNRRVVLSTFGYVLGLGIAVSLHDRLDLSGPATFAISLLPALPTFGIVWAMVRYLAEENDEFLRHRTIMSAMAGLGAVLALGIFWGFLEMFEVVPHIWAWWVLPVWALGLGLSRAWLAMRDRAEADE